MNKIKLAVLFMLMNGCHSQHSDSSSGTDSFAKIESHLNGNIYVNEAPLKTIGLTEKNYSGLSGEKIFDKCIFCSCKTKRGELNHENLAFERINYKESYLDSSYKFGIIHALIKNPEAGVDNERVHVGMTKKNLFESLYKGYDSDLDKYDTIMFHGPASWTYLNLIFSKNVLSEIEYFNYPD